jgi:predicted PurR-regulated permease PerM
VTNSVPEEPQDGPHRGAGGIVPLPDARARRVARALLAAGLFLLGLWVVRDFLPALAWAVVIAVTLWPLYARFAALLPQRGRAAALAPAVFTLLTVAALLVPLAFVLGEIGRESRTALAWIAQAQQNGIPAPGWLARAPAVGEHAAAWWRAHLSDPEAARGMLGRLDAKAWADWTRMFGTEILHRVLLAFVAFMALYGLLRHGARLGGRLLALADRFLGDPGEELAGRVIAAVRGTVNGTVLVALGEAALITVGYVVTGVPNPVLFGAVTAAFALVPLGAWVAFGAASVVLLLTGGGALMAAGLFGFGAAVMLVGDNFVQPAVIGGASRLPFLWALIGILGGLQSFGVLGLFIGPVIMAALLSVWREWLDAQARGKAVPAEAARVEE